ncbi:MAG: type II toxin-antitoxin system ParD family antitoxin [Tistlia sp.]|uniref:type II toxin-antitoxin system ParD family antitoxin n=1 Tax=Tistlia sp. TaxID=3057121 RepID=UPI0034A4B392
MKVSLTPELERFVAEQVTSGLYRSASEVVRASLRLLEQAERRGRINHDPSKNGGTWQESWRAISTPPLRCHHQRELVRDEK